MSPLVRSLAALLLFVAAAAAPIEVGQPAGTRIRVLLDTDATNELDDQHAIAYLLFNGGIFDVDGITVNRTRGGGDVTQHYGEAERVVRLASLHGRVPLRLGANGSFTRSKATWIGLTTTAWRPCASSSNGPMPPTGDRWCCCPLGS